MPNPQYSLPDLEFAMVHITEGWGGEDPRWGSLETFILQAYFYAMQHPASAQAEIDDAMTARFSGRRGKTNG